MIGFLYQDNKSSLFHYERSMNSVGWSDEREVGLRVLLRGCHEPARRLGLCGGFPGGVRWCEAVQGHSP